jgi:hypothetical protein
MEPLPASLEEKRRALARSLGRPVQVRGIRTPEIGFRGRLRVEPHRAVIEYQMAQAGYFWHVPVIEELLDRAAAGEREAELWEPSAASREPPPGR